MGDLGCFFFNKNLGGYGDGGMIVTRDGMTRRLKLLRTWKESVLSS
jgi:dTDP-4-amino-4,6-dideoxygalactose transaminase